MESNSTRCDKVENNGAQSVRIIDLPYLEFYSGIGGWGYAFSEACDRVSGNSTKNILFKPIRLAAYDHSSLANDVLDYNHRRNSAVMKNASGQDHHDGADEHVDDGKSCSRSTIINQVQESSTNKTRKPKKIRRRHPQTTEVSAGGRIVHQTPIEKLTLKDLTESGAKVWLMSPPCQPYTRQNSQMTDNHDPRSQSFLHLCRILADETFTNLPQLICLENVIRFEQSQCFYIWRQTLLQRGYSLGHYHLTPSQIGIPNERERYYCVAVLLSTTARATTNDTWLQTYQLERQVLPNIRPTTTEQECSSHDDPPVATTDHPPKISKNIPLLDLIETCDTTNTSYPRRPLESFLDQDLPPMAGSQQDLNKVKLDQLQIPEKLFNSDASWCFDIISISSNHDDGQSSSSNSSSGVEKQEPKDCGPPNSSKGNQSTSRTSRNTSCFTHSYGNFARGAGSILYIGNTNNAAGKDCVTQLKEPHERQFDTRWKDALKRSDLRYFSGTEMARLMGFPVVEEENDTCTGDERDKCNDDDDAVVLPSMTCALEERKQQSPRSSKATFCFPPSCSMKNQWKLLGNSLNVQVASKVAQVGLMAMLEDYSSKPM